MRDLSDQDILIDCYIDILILISKLIKSLRCLSTQISYREWGQSGAPDDRSLLFQCFGILDLHLQHGTLSDDNQSQKWSIGCLKHLPRILVLQTAMTPRTQVFRDYVLFKKKNQNCLIFQQTAFRWSLSLSTVWKLQYSLLSAFKVNIPSTHSCIITHQNRPYHFAFKFLC